MKIDEPPTPYNYGEGSGIIVYYQWFPLAHHCTDDEAELEEQTDLNTALNAALKDIPEDPKERKTTSFADAKEDQGSNEEVSGDYFLTALQRNLVLLKRREENTTTNFKRSKNTKRRASLWITEVNQHYEYRLPILFICSSIIVNLILYAPIVQ